MTSDQAPGGFRRILANVGWLLTGKGVGAVLSLVYLGLATRSLGLALFGQFTLILSTAQAVAALVAFQSWQIVVRFGVGSRAAGNHVALQRLVRFSALLDLAAAALGCLVAALAIALIGPRLGWPPALRREALVFAIVLLVTVRSTAVGILRLHDRFGVGAAADAVTPIVRVVGAVAAVIAGPSVSRFLLAWAIAEVLTALVYWISAYRTAPQAFAGWRRLGGHAADHPGLWRFALVTNLSSTLAATSKQVLVVVVGLVAGTASAGAYRLAFQVSQALARLADMFARGSLPEFARAHGAATRDDLRRLFRQSTRLTGLLGLAICVAAPLLAAPVLWIIGGSAYAHAYPLVVMLALAAAVDIMGVGFEPVLLATGHAGLALRIRVASVAALVVAAVLLAPAWEAAGVAAATLVAALVGLALFGRAARRAVS